MHQDSGDSLGTPNAHLKGQLGIDAARPVDLPGGGMNFADQAGEPLLAYLRRRYRPLLCL